MFGLNYDNLEFFNIGAPTGSSRTAPRTPSTTARNQQAASNPLSALAGSAGQGARTTANTGRQAAGNVGSAAARTGQAAQAGNARGASLGAQNTIGATRTGVNRTMGAARSGIDDFSNTATSAVTASNTRTTARRDAGSRTRDASQAAGLRGAAGSVIDSRGGAEAAVFDTGRLAVGAGMAGAAASGGSRMDAFKSASKAVGRTLGREAIHAAGHFVASMGQQLEAGAFDCTLGLLSSDDPKCQNVLEVALEGDTAEADAMRNLQAVSAFQSAGQGDLQFR